MGACSKKKKNTGYRVFSTATWAPTTFCLSHLQKISPFKVYMNRD